MILESDAVEYRYFQYFGDAEVSERDGKIVLTVDVKKDVTGDASVEWFTGNDWERTGLVTEKLELKAGKQEIVFTNRSEIDLNSEEYEEFYQGFIEELSKAEEDGMLDQLSEEEREEYRKIAKMSKEELFYYVSGTVPSETLLTAPLRINIANEYVYVNLQ